MVRAVGSMGAEPSAEEDGETESLYMHDPLYGWTKRPNATTTVRTAEYDVTETTNGLGLRGRETTREKPEGTKRVLLLGDSFLEGYSVAYDDLVSTQLELLLGQETSEAVEVLNAGTAGYSTDQELLYFRREGRTLEPDVTVLLFYTNDVYYNVLGRYWRGLKPRFELSDTGLVLQGVPIPPPDPERTRPVFVDRGGRGIVQLLRRLDAWLGPRSALHRLVVDAAENSPTISGLAYRIGAVDIPVDHKPWQRSPDPETARAWAVTEALLGRLRDEVATAGSDFRVFYVPSRPAVYDDDWRRTRRAYAIRDDEWSPSADGEMLRRICQRAGIECIIGTEQFKSEARRLLASGERLYFQVDSHWTPAGHRLAARLMADNLRGSF